MAKKDRKQRKKKRREERLRQAKHQRNQPKFREGLPYWLTERLPEDELLVGAEGGLDDIDDLDDDEDLDDSDWDDEEDLTDDELADLNEGLTVPAVSPFAIERRLRLMSYAMTHQRFPSGNEMRAWIDSFFAANKNGDLSALEDPREQAQELAYRSMESTDLAEIERLAREALKLDPACVDALVRLIPFQAGTDLDRQLELYQQALDLGRRALGGDDYFEEFAGDFGSQIETCPYLRALYGYGSVQRAKQNIIPALAAFSEMLRLDPDDNQGARYPLLSCAFETGEFVMARKIMNVFKEDDSALMRSAWVLERWHASDFQNARRALTRLHYYNSFVAYMLAGLTTVPDASEPPHPGSPGEAREVFLIFGQAWIQNPQAREWLAEQCENPGKP